MPEIPLREQIAAVAQAAKAERAYAERTVYEAEQQIMLRRAAALEAAANMLRALAASRSRRRGSP